MKLINAILFEAEIPGHGVEGLPDEVNFSDRQLERAINRNNRGVFRAVAAPSPDREGAYNVHLHPAHPGKALPYAVRPGAVGSRAKVAYYDPELADLETMDPGVEYIERTYARAKPHLTREFVGLPDEHLMYRGMSKEEYDSFLETGEVKSTGDYNLGGQEGLTYWTTQPSSAQSYANSFAPMQWKPTIGHPCYILAAHLPDRNDIQPVRGTGEHEVGVKRAIHASEVVAAWEGRVFNHHGDAYELRPINDSDHTDAMLSGRTIPDDHTHRVRYGGYSADVVWQRIQ